MRSNLQCALTIRSVGGLHGGDHDDGGFPVTAGHHHSLFAATAKRKIRNSDGQSKVWPAAIPGCRSSRALRMTTPMSSVMRSTPSVLGGNNPARSCALGSKIGRARHLVAGV